jgi:hypothetical protein
MFRFHEKSRFAVAALVAGSVWAISASAETSATKPASATPHAMTTKASNKASVKPARSPYARAAAQHEHAGDAPAGHAPTMVQGIGRSHKPHAGAPKK